MVVLLFLASVKLGVHAVPMCVTLPEHKRVKPTQHLLDVVAQIQVHKHVPVMVLLMAFVKLGVLAVPMCVMLPEHKRVKPTQPLLDAVAQIQVQNHVLVYVVILPALLQAVL